MKIIEDINKLIVKKVIGIVFIIGFVSISTFSLHNKNSKELLDAITAVSNLNHTSFYIKNPINYELSPMSDDDALEKLSPTSIIVDNETYTNDFYKLVLKINKSSELDYRYLHMSVFDTVYALTELERADTEKDYVFVFVHDNIKATSKNYDVRLWLNTLADNEMQSKNMIIEFDLETETTRA